ncbi:MAG: PAS domain-containing protein [Rhodobacteraceae bacterium]|nr:PAS domain-containing protein [Paracoccaceae bacterium]
MYLFDTLDQLSDPALAIDGKARIVGWSPGAEDLFGHSADSVIGQRCGDIVQGIYPNGEPMCTPMCEAVTCLKGGKKHSVDTCLLRHKDGNVFPASIDHVRLSPGAGETAAGPAVSVMFIGKVETATRVAPPALLRIFSLGHFSLVLDGAGLAVDSWKRKQALTVLKFLVGKVNRPVHREVLIKALSPDADPGRGWDRLKVAVSYLRSQLQQSGVEIDPVLTLDQSYLLRGDVVWIDAVEFEKLLVAGNRHAQEQRVDEALVCFEDASRLYRGDFLEDDPHADWCSQERERLREGYFDMLAGMAKCQAAKGDYRAAAQSYQRALYRDQSRESFLRGLLDSLGKLDGSGVTPSQLDIWKHNLDKEFQNVPKPEHMQIYEELIRAKQDDPEVSS